MVPNPEQVLPFLRRQFSEYGGKLEIDDGLYALFVVEATDESSQARVKSLLADIDFPYDSGSSSDERMVIFYVDSEHQHAAMHWLEDTIQLFAGEIRPVSAAQQELIDAVGASDKPHRAAKELADLHEADAVTAGLIRDPQIVRHLLDRLHAREPLFFTAFQTLLSHHLIDMLELFRQLIGEDLALFNEIVKAGLSRDPFLQSRQDSTAEIRNFLISFRIINPMDQMKNLGIKNPYAAYLELAVASDEIIAPIDGIKVTLQRENFLNSIRLIRSNLYQGHSFESFDTQSPWITPETAHPFRFIRQRLSARSDLKPLDALYMLERAVAT